MTAMIMLPVCWAVVVGVLLLAAGCALCAAVLTALGRWPKGFAPLRTWGDLPRRRAGAAMWRLPVQQQGQVASGKGQEERAAGRVATCAACGRGLTGRDTIFFRLGGAVHCHRCAGR